MKKILQVGKLIGIFIAFGVIYTPFIKKNKDVIDLSKNIEALADIEGDDTSCYVAHGACWLYVNGNAMSYEGLRAI